MEHEWNQSLCPRTKGNFRAKRYMDDVLLFYVENATFDATRFLTDFRRSECYMPPLSLEPATAGTFLETSFEIDDYNQIQHWVKNVNVQGQPATVWRYAHYGSFGRFATQKAVLLACLKKVHAMASNDKVLISSAVQKIAEFKRLQYPYKLMWSMCTTMGVHTRTAAWIEGRNTLSTI